MGDKEEEELAMDEADEKELEEGKARSKRSRLKCFAHERRGTSKRPPQGLYIERRCEEEK